MTDKETTITTPSFANLTSDDFSAIGRVSASCGVLEHELMRAIIGLHGGPEAVQEGSDLEKKIEQHIGGTFGSRLRAFIETYKEKDGDLTWIDDFDSKLSEGLELRNHFLHGLWWRDGDDLICEFYKRGKGKSALPVPASWRGPTSDLIKLAAANITNAKLLAAHFH